MSSHTWVKDWWWQSDVSDSEGETDILCECVHICPSKTKHLVPKWSSYKKIAVKKKKEIISQVDQSFYKLTSPNVLNPGGKC